MTDEKRPDFSTGMGQIYLAEISGEGDETLDETLEGIDRFFNIDEGCLVSDEEVAFFFNAISKAGQEILRKAGLPVDPDALEALEEFYNYDLYDQPHKPRFIGPSSNGSGCYCAINNKNTYHYNKSAFEKALEEWKTIHAAYWENLKNEPEVRLFSDEKLLAAFRLQQVCGTVVDAIQGERLVAALANAVKFTMLAIRAGVFDKVQKAIRSTKGRKSGADITNEKFRNAETFCIAEAKKIWAVDTIRMTEMAEKLEALLIEKKMTAPTPKVIKGYLNKAAKEGKLTIPPDAKKPGAPKKSP